MNSTTTLAVKDIGTYTNRLRHTSRWWSSGHAATARVKPAFSDDMLNMGRSGAVSDEVSMSPDLLVTLDRIQSLKDEETEDDRPSAFAEQAARTILLTAAGYLASQFPRASASVGPSRSLRLIWRLPQGEARLTVDGEKATKSYLYLEPKAGESFIAETVSGDKLAAAIRSLF